VKPEEVLATRCNKGIRSDERRDRIGGISMVAEWCSMSSDCDAIEESGSIRCPKGRRRYSRKGQKSQTDAQESDKMLSRGSW